MGKTILAAVDPAAPMREASIYDIIWDAAAQVAKEMNEEVHVISTSSGATVRPGETVGQFVPDVLVADLASSAPAVMIAVGQAQARSVPVLLLAADPGNVPSELAGSPVVVLTGENFGRRAPRLAEALKKAMWPPAPGEKVATNEPCTVFISYSHADLAFVQRILVHLRPLERAGLIDAWSDAKLTPGGEWKGELRAALQRAKIAVLVISADFLASEFIATDELPPLLAAAEARGARILPLIAKPSRFLRDARLSRYQAANDPAAPLIAVAEAQREEVYAKLADAIELEVNFERGLPA